MASKYDLITGIFNEQIARLTQNQENWTSFLKTAANNYKYTFIDQTLIHAQRPDATACAEIEIWNEKFNRWVNKGAKGIALFDYSAKVPRLRYVFDVSDTNSFYGNEVELWRAEKRYDEEIKEALSNAFGETAGGSLAAVIDDVAQNMAEDNSVDYLPLIEDLKVGSFLEELDTQMIAPIFKTALANSIGYAMMTRCGINADDFYDKSDFRDVMNFNSHPLVISFGTAVSEIAEMGLREIESTVRNLQRNERKKNRTFDKATENEYDEGVIKNETERSNENGRDNIQTGGRLFDSESDSSEGRSEAAEQVRSDEKIISSEQPKSPLGNTYLSGQTDESSLRDSRTGSGDGRAAYGSDDDITRFDGRIQGTESNEVGSDDEQHSELSSGDSVDGFNLRLDWYDRSNEDKSLPFFGNTERINEILLTTPYLKASKDVIRQFYETHFDDGEREEYIKSIFNNDYTEVILSDGKRYGYKTYENVLHLWEGSYVKRTSQSFYDWGVIAKHFEGMRLLGQLYNDTKPLPSVEGQITFIEQAEAKKTSAFSFSQEIVDSILTRGSGVSEGKMRIYEQFQKSLSSKENVEFLKNEYGWGGIAPAITGTNIDEMHDAKGIRISIGFGSNNPHLDLSWAQVEKRISELISLDRYLNPKEKEAYPGWLEKQEEQRIENALEAERRKILQTAPPEQKEYEYQFHLGDTVYIGADEYTITSLTDPVILNDAKFPLFTKELPKAEFEQKVKENPANNHLRAEVVPTKTDTEKNAEKQNDIVDDLFDEETVIEEQASGNPIWDEYSKIKAENPDSIVFYQLGDFFEIMGDDASKASEALDIILTSRRINGDEKIPMCGIPKHNLETYLGMMNDRGYDVTVSTFENGERQNRLVVSVNKEDPVESRAIGRIEYLHTDGSVRESIEYTSEYQLKRDIQQETFFGVPMNIVLYRDKDGNTVPHEYISELDPPPNGFSIIDSPYLQPKEQTAEFNDDDLIGKEITIDDSKYVIERIGKISGDVSMRDVTFQNSVGFPVNRVEKIGYVRELYRQQTELLDRAKALITEYQKEEFGEDAEADFTSLDSIGLAFTNTEDGKYDIQAEADLVHFNISTFVGGKLVRTEQYKSLEDMVENGLPGLAFDDLVYLSDEELEKVQSPTNYTTEKVAEYPAVENGLPYDVVIETLHIDEPNLTPAWEQRTERKPELLQPTIPESEKHNYRITDDNIGAGGAKARFHNNMAAINLLHELEFENRLATSEEQEVLAKYAGFGGLADAFDETKGNWADEYKELIVTLTPEEYAAARESTLTAFYTPPVVIRSVYKALENMGFKTGNILEPSCGVGNFMGMLPESMKDSKFYGVELDSLTGRIAQQLYQKANIAVQGYETTALPDSFFDVAVGNVPFGQFKVLDKKYDKHNWNIHDYFFGKTLDKVRPGGVIAFVTSSWTMDKKNPNVRKYIAQRAELLGAIRLPDNTFKANAGTDVVSDILFLQKRDTLTNEEPSWVHLGRDENGNEINQYFIDNPEMILGELVTESSQYGQRLTCKPYADVPLETLLNDAIQNIHADYSELDVSEVGEQEDLSSIPADPSVKNFSYTIVDGKIYFRENSRMNEVDVSETAKNRIKGMIEIRDCVRTLIELQTEDYPDNAIKAEQEKLNTLYDTFTKKYGLINSRANNSAFSSDSSYYLLCSLEVIGENGELKRKADMFTKRTIKPNVKVTAVSTASEALAVSIGEKACVDMDFMQELTGKTEQELYEDLQGVIFLNPQADGKQNEYVTADEYLSGNVRKKLEAAREYATTYPEYAVNVEALEKVQPEELGASDISVRLGATWLPVEDVQNFMFELLQTPRYAQWNIKVHYSPYTAEWNIENKSYDRTNVMANSTYGTDRVNAYKIIEETLNLRDVRIFDYIEDEYGNRKPVLNKKETAIAQGKQELIKQGFQDWIWKNPERRQRLVKLYNEKFNSMRAREYDGRHITFSGMNPEITLRPHQINAVARIMYGGNTLLAHVVGAGKTFEIVAASQESKRLGLCNKSLIVVPNHLTEQWASEYLQLYPSANILVATKKDFETKNRKKFCARIATGDYDAVIIGHSQFEKIPLSVDRQRLMLQQQIDEITDGIAQMKYNRGERFTVKQLEKTKKSLQTKLDKLNDQSRKDDVITFEELGVDRLFVDEAHNFKNLFLVTKMRNVGGIAQTEAQKSSDLFMKCRYLDEVTNSKGVIFATGTPVSNSMVELYTMQRYLQYETLKDKNLQHFDAWASTFGETVTAIELAPEGTGYRTKTRFAKFYNLPELMMMFRQVADIQTADMLKLPVPEVVRKNIAITPSEIQKELVASLADRAEKVRNKMVDSSVDNMLLITNDGRKLALDQRLSNDMLPDDPNGKVSTCADNVYEIWDRTTPQKSAQLVFCDLSTPHNDGKFNVYDDIRSKLIAKGIPESEIAFIHTADTEAKKKDLFAKVRAGQVRVLIGSTFKMGAGTNVQKRLIAEHHLDCPWRPADVGRILRTVKIKKNVEVNRQWQRRFLRKWVANTKGKGII